MPDTTDTPDAAPAADAVVEVSTDTPLDAESPNAEAAKYRRQLRDTEAARDALTERVAAMQRRECEAALADLLDVPADVWDIGRADPAAFYSEDGSLNLADLRAAAGALIDQRPRLGKTRPTPQWGQNSGELPTAGISWNTVVKG